MLFSRIGRFQTKLPMKPLLVQLKSVGSVSVQRVNSSVGRSRGGQAALSCLFLCVCIALASRGFAGETQLIDAAEKRHGGSVYFNGQLAQSGVMILDANNGFFDKGVFKAEGKHAAPDAAEKALIHFHYSHLVAAEKQSTGTAHWYLWVAQPGEVRCRVHLNVPATDKGIRWVIQLDGQSRTVTASASGQSTAQKWDLAFDVKRTGKHRVSIRKVSNRSAAKTELHSIRLSGSAIPGSSILRTRWRPAAIHTQYFSSTCPESKMWVMETQNISDYGSYSPITTPFGYFGGSLRGDRTALGNMNFSMWAANSKAKTAPGLSQMPHLLAVGNPNAEFGGFGHEGSGVKVRNWEPLAHHPRSIIQALRMEVADGSVTYSGYLFDDRVNQWVLYAVGRRPQKKAKQKAAKQKKVNGKAAPSTKRPSVLNNLRIASFCEIPGPASNERTGDRQRVIRRRGWVLDENHDWNPIDRQTRSFKPNAGPVNQYIAADDEGWFVMSTGGLEQFDSRQTEVRPAKSTSQLPAWLQPKVAAQLFEYPAMIGEHSTNNVDSTSAVVDYKVINIGSNAKATLYYGTQDCLSFVGRKEFHATEKKGVIGEIYAADRTWNAAVSGTVGAHGDCQFQLRQLKPGNTYYYRLLLSNDSGKIWSFDAGQFDTLTESPQ